ncbi:Uncharacterised protein [Vibrio cholerae]|nr:Uncharacterised protein [Vibrio cholerae]CSC73513.1 Uncharacterised protein [Vibrio cholerae]CSI69962.1 Uncharacterised protein [Vibrio cholerae]
MTRADADGHVAFGVHNRVGFHVFRYFPAEQSIFQLSVARLTSRNHL